MNTNSRFIYSLHKMFSTPKRKPTYTVCELVSNFSDCLRIFPTYVNEIST